MSKSKFWLASGAAVIFGIFVYTWYIQRQAAGASGKLNNNVSAPSTSPLIFAGDAPGILLGSTERVAESFVQVSTPDQMAWIEKQVKDAPGFFLDESFIDQTDSIF